MKRSVCSTVTTVAVAVTATMSLSAAITFTSTFKSPDASSVSFAGRKVAALVISSDDSLRVAGEESLVRELNARGMQGVATYRIAPKEELRRAETARPWFEKANVEGVVAVRPVSADTTETHTSSTWISPTYSSLWSYYGYGWGSRGRSWLGAAGDRGRRRIHDLQRPARPAPVGGCQRDKESARAARVHRRAREALGRGDAEAGAGEAPAAIEHDASGLRFQGSRFQASNMGATQNLELGTWNLEPGTWEPKALPPPTSR